MKQNGFSPSANVRYAQSLLTRRSAPACPDKDVYYNFAFIAETVNVFIQIIRVGKDNRRLTVDHQHYSLADRRRDPVGRYAQIRSHVKAADPRQIQDRTLDAVHCNTQKQCIVVIIIKRYRKCHHKTTFLTAARPENPKSTVYPVRFGHEDPGGNRLNYARAVCKRVVRLVNRGTPPGCRNFYSSNTPVPRLFRKKKKK